MLFGFSLAKAVYQLLSKIGFLIPFRLNSVKILLNPNKAGLFESTFFLGGERFNLTLTSYFKKN